MRPTNAQRAFQRVLNHPGFALSGTVTTKYLTCGKPNCRCRQGDKHGPYHYLTRDDAWGRRVQVYLPAAVVPLVRDMIAFRRQREADDRRQAREDMALFRRLRSSLRAQEGALRSHMQSHRGLA